MISWLLAALVGAIVMAWQYGRGAFTPRFGLPALLRFAAVLLVTALLLDAPAGRAATPRPDVLLDASESWLRAAPRCDRWRMALDSAAALGGGGRLLFGDSVRAAGATSAPDDNASRLRQVADRAAGTGRPVVLITDGELDDPDALAALPRGSRAIVMPCAPGRDAAVASLDAPRTMLAGDTITTRVTIAAGGAGASAGQVEIRLDSAMLATTRFDALAPWGENTVELRGVPAGGERASVLRAIVRSDGDAEPRNDTLGVGVDVSRAPAAVFVSSAPDFDSREAVAALRGVTSLPTRAYYRVAPGVWRAEGSLARAEERDVRAAVRDAPLVILHGDTSLFGAPRAATRGALLLFAPPTGDEGDWFAAAAPPSPLSAALTSLPFDSLPPLNVGPRLPRGDWEGLVARRRGGASDGRPVLVGWDEPRHVAILGASGLWRWRFRGGTRADAYGAFFGSLYDWLASGRTDRRAAVPAADAVRAGAPIRWRRGASADTVVQVTVTRRSATGRVYTMSLRFDDGAGIAESAPLQPGVYDARMAGGSVVLVVNASRELVPRRPSVVAGTIGGAAALGDAPSLRSIGWMYVAAVLLLCAEWLLRRRMGVK